jgi:hypothetical protein
MRKIYVKNNQKIIVEDGRNNIIEIDNADEAYDVGKISDKAFRELQDNPSKASQYMTKGRLISTRRNDGKTFDNN